MTCFEKLKHEHPEYVREDCWGGARGCPCDYGYMDDPDGRHCGISSDECVDCWNREIPDTETVNHPAHYQGKHECIDEMLALFGVEAVKHFCMCNVYKYRFRANQKNGLEDIQKAEWYMDKLMELEKATNDD